MKREAMVPVACLMNHAAAAPHIRQYGQLEDGWLHFPASRAISEGEQVHFAKHASPYGCGIHCHMAYLRRHLCLCRQEQALMPMRWQVHLHYGSYDNAHLLVFYGFVLPNNPNDSVSISIKVRLCCYSNRYSGMQAFYLPQLSADSAQVLLLLYA
jgi:hypothetical protein